MCIDLGQWSACFWQEIGRVLIWGLLPLAGWRFEKRTSGFFQLKFVRVFDLDLTLMSPTGDTMGLFARG